MIINSSETKTMKKINFDNAYSICNFLKHFDAIREVKIGKEILELTDYRTIDYTEEDYEQRKWRLELFSEKENNFCQFSIGYKNKGIVYVLQFFKYIEKDESQIRVMIRSTYTNGFNGYNLFGARGSERITTTIDALIKELILEITPIINEPKPCDSCIYGSLYNLSNKCIYKFRSKDLDKKFYETRPNAKS